MKKGSNEYIEKSGWIGVDLDGTLALYNDWRDYKHIGEPIPLMLERVKHWISIGQEVRIVTARISFPETRTESIKVIEKWCIKHVGQKLLVTNEKDFAMIELWDDRCVQVIPNTGKRADGLVE